MIRRIGLSASTALVILSLSAAHAAEHDPVDELAKRSGLPPAEISASLANCDANQTNLNICAWRDVIVAEQDLKKVADERSASSPSCKKAIDRRLDGWTAKRDRVCKESAAEEYGGGSAEPMALAICESSSTHDMAKEIQSLHCSK
jgi:uncharacterized protein YecT (DUF1311 family)